LRIKNNIKDYVVTTRLKRSRRSLPEKHGIAFDERYEWGYSF
jgi:hypothetical protein